MRYGIRVSALVLMWFFVLALVAAIWGERESAVAAAAKQGWKPGPVLVILLLGSGVTALALFIGMSGLGLTLAFRRRAWFWMIALALITVGVVLVDLIAAWLVPPLDGVRVLLFDLVPLPFFPKLGVIVFLPMFVGSAMLVIYSDRAEKDTPRVGSALMDAG